MSGHAGLARWHYYMMGGADPAVLSDLLADDVVFHSPVVHSPQEGKAKVMLYLLSAAKVLGNDSFHYVREIVDGDTAVLEFALVLVQLLWMLVVRRMASFFVSAKAVQVV